MLNPTVARKVSYHVEPPRHDILLADALRIESYVDPGDRATFVSPDETRKTAS